MFVPSTPQVVYVGGPEPRGKGSWVSRWYLRLGFIVVASMVAAMVLGQTPAATAGSATYAGRNLLSWGNDHYIVNDWDTSGYAGVAAEYTIEMQPGFAGWARWECETYSYTAVAFSWPSSASGTHVVNVNKDNVPVSSMFVGAGCGSHTAYHIFSAQGATGNFRITNAVLIASWYDNGPAPSEGLPTLGPDPTVQPSNPFPGWTYCPAPMPSGFIGPPNPSLCPEATAPAPTATPGVDGEIAWVMDGAAVNPSEWLSLVTCCNFTNGYKATNSGGVYGAYSPYKAAYKGTSWIGQSSNFWLPTGTGTMQLVWVFHGGTSGNGVCEVSAWEIGYVHSPYFTTVSLQYSQNESTWTTLDTPGTGPFTRREVTPTRAKYWRWQGTTASGGGDNGFGGMNIYGQCDASGADPTAAPTPTAGPTAPPAPTPTPRPPSGGGPNPPPTPVTADYCLDFPNRAGCVEVSPEPTLPTFGPAPSDSGSGGGDGVPDGEPVPGGECESDPTLKAGYVPYTQEADFRPFNERWDESFTYDNGWGSVPLLGQMYAFGWFLRDLIGSLPGKAENTMTWLWNQLDNLLVPGDCLWLTWEEFVATLDEHVPFGYVTQGLPWLINEFEDTSAGTVDMTMTFASPMGGADWSVDVGTTWDEVVDGLGPYRELFRALAYLVFLVRLISLAARAIKVSLEPKQLGLGL